MQREEKEETYVLLDGEEVDRIVEMSLAESSFLDHLVRNLAFQLHDQQEHVIICSTRKQNPVIRRQRRPSRLGDEDSLAGVQLVQRASDRPNVKRAVVGKTQNCDRESVAILEECRERLTDFWRTVESTDKVRRDVVLGRIGS